MDNPQSIRLNKFLAERLGVSRREADELISAGKITVNGTTASLGARVCESDKVNYNHQPVSFQTDYIYLAFHKPVGYVCSRRAQGSAPTIYDLLPPKYHKLKTVGRLDKDSSGLILLTNDGNFAYQMTHPKFRKTKVYEVDLDRPLAPLHQQMISDYGVMLDDGPSQFKVIHRVTDSSSKHDQSKPTSTSSTSTTPLTASYTVILTEGRNRQIRRTFASLGYRVIRLHRISFGKYELGDLQSQNCVIIEP